MPLSAEFIVDFNVTFWVLIGELALFSMCLGIMQSSTFGLGGVLPGKYMGAIMMGNGYAAIFMNALRAICLLSIPEHQIFLSSMIFFIVAAGVMIFSAFVHI